MLNNPNFQRQVIMDHYEHPRNKKVNETYRSKRMDNDSCIDDFTVYLDVQDGVIADVSFDGKGCTISTSSISIMTELVKGETVEQARLIAHEFMKMIHLEDYDASLLKEAIVFENVGRQANRIQCATLGWQGLTIILNEREVENNG